MARTNVTSLRNYRGSARPVPGIRSESRRTKRRFRFRPRSFWPYLSWGFVLFVGFRVVLFPLVEGIYQYINKTQEMCELKVRYDSLQQQLAKLKQTREQMKTMGYVEARGHQIGLIKPNEEPMLVIDSGSNRPGVIKINKPSAEIGD